MRNVGLHGRSLLPLRRHEMAEGDHSLVGVEQLCTGCESQEALSPLPFGFRLARVRILWKGIDDPALGEIDHQVVTTSVEDVGEDLCPGLDNNLITRLQFWHSPQRFAVGDTMRCQRVVSDATGAAGIL